MLAWDYAHLIKMSEEEMRFLSGEQDWSRAIQKLWTDQLKLLVVTRGPLGCHYSTESTQGHIPGYRVKTVDTTGAGDGFVAGLLAALVDKGLATDPDWLPPMLRFANAVGALATSKRGAIPSLPKYEEVLALMEKGSGG